MSHEAEIKWEILEAFLAFGHTAEAIAIYFGLDESTLRRRVMENYGMSFTRLKKQQESNLSLRLEKRAIDMALDGDRTMLLACLRRISGWGKNNVGNPVESIEKLITSAKQGGQHVGNSGARAYIEADHRPVEAKKE